MSERLRICLGCGKPFKSLSSANRFCKLCKKRRKRLKGAFEGLNTSELPPALATAVVNRYYEGPKPVKVVYALDEYRKTRGRKRTTPLQTGWGPPYPLGLLTAPAS